VPTPTLASTTVQAAIEELDAKPRVDLTEPGPIGGTTPAAGTFTELAATGNTTLGDASTDTLNVGNGDIVKNAAGRTLIGGGTDDGVNKLQVVNGGIVSRNTGGNSQQILVQNSDVTLDIGVYNAYMPFGAAITTVGAHDLKFGTNNTEAARITSTGNILIGTTTDDEADKLQVNGSINIPVTSAYKLGTAAIISYSGGNIIITDAGGGLLLKGTNTTSIYTAGSEKLAVNSTGQAVLKIAGAGLSIMEGPNAKQGTATLVAGTVTVLNTSVTVNSRIFLTSQVDGGTPGFLRVSFRVAGTSFTIASSSTTDTSTVAYEIFEPS
jgi:hypothetical protein